MPENRIGAYGPADPSAPSDASPRHPIITGFDEADILPFGGYLPRMRAGEGTEVLATWVPEFPIFPPETSWMREPRSDVPAIVVTEKTSARLIWLLADLDRCYARDGSFEHAQIIANAVKWALRDRDAARIEGGTGLVALTAYVQDGRSIVHLNSRIVTSPVPGRQETLVPLPNVRLRLRWPGLSLPKVECRVSRTTPQVVRRGEFLSATVSELHDHEVVVFG